jgi:hypothetical protein
VAPELIFDAAMGQFRLPLGNSLRATSLAGSPPVNRNPGDGERGDGYRPIASLSQRVTRFGTSRFRRRHSIRLSQPGRLCLLTQRAVNLTLARLLAFTQLPRSPR